MDLRKLVFVTKKVGKNYYYKAIENLQNTANWYEKIQKRYKLKSVKPIM